MIILPDYSDIKLNVLGTMEDSDFGKEIAEPRKIHEKQYFDETKKRRPIAPKKPVITRQEKVEAIEFELKYFRLKRKQATEPIERDKLSKAIYNSVQRLKRLNKGTYE